MAAGLCASVVPLRAGGAGPGIAAQPAGRFVDSVGCNVHISSPPYRDAFPKILRLLGELGVRHLRDELRPSNDLERWRRLFRLGIRGHLLVSPATNTVAEMMGYLQALGPEAVSAIEGQNEGDSPWFMAQPAARGGWAAAVVAYHAQVHGALRGRYGAGVLPLVSPTVLDYRPGDMRLLRAVAPLCDVVAVHAYPQGRQEPETEEEYASLAWYRRAFAEPFKPGAPVMATEAGYFTGAGGVPAAVQAKYTPRLLLHAFTQGFRRSFLYELMDEGTDAGDPEQNYGLVDAGFRPKPAFHALRMLLGALAEKAPLRGPCPSFVETCSGPADLRVAAFAKGDGEHVVALWRAARSWDPARRSGIAVPAEAVELGLAAAVGEAASLLLAEGQEWRTLAVTAGRVALRIDDNVTLVRLWRRRAAPGAQGG